MKKKNKPLTQSELLQRIESSITSALQILNCMQTGNLAHSRGNAICILSSCKNIYIKKLRELLKENEKEK